MGRTAAKAKHTDDTVGGGARIPPHCSESEQALLGSCLLDARVLDVVAGIVAEGDFYRAAHGAIFRACAELARRREPVDLVTVKEWLERHGELAGAGGALYLAELTEAVPNAANAKHYAGIVRDKATLRELGRIAGAIEARVHEAHEPAAAIVERAEQELFALTRRRLGQETKAAGELIGAYLEGLRRRRGAGREETAIPTGFPDLDERLRGLRRGAFCVLAGRPSMGKTSLALNFLRHIALPSRHGFGRGAAIFSLEMSAEEILEALLCCCAGIDAHGFEGGGGAEYDELLGVAEELAGQRLFIDDAPTLSVGEVRAKARRLVAEQGIELVVIDYLQLLRGPRSESRQQEVAEISRELKGLARELGIPILALSQLSRRVETREDKRPFLSDLRESGAIEQDADVVLLLHREEQYHPERGGGGGEADVAELIVAKNRHGPTGTVRLRFLREFRRFETYRG